MGTQRALVGGGRHLDAIVGHGYAAGGRGVQVVVGVAGGAGVAGSAGGAG